MFALYIELTLMFGRYVIHKSSFETEISNQHHLLIKNIIVNKIKKMF